MRSHKFEPAAIQHLDWERGYPETLVLYRCKCGCGGVRTEKIRGRWTPEQLGVMPAAAPLVACAAHPGGCAS